jgi:transcriptional regulator with XRE-family HTH domain
MDTKLKRIAKQKKITLTELAKQLEISRVHLTNIANGREPAGKRLAKKIEIWSDGQITHSELIYPD